MNKLDQAREQVFYADITAELARTRQRACHGARSIDSPSRPLGPRHRIQAARRSPDPPAPPANAATIERDAITCRVDLQVVRMELDALARLYELKQATRFINVLDAGYKDKLTSDRETGARIRSRGFEVELQVPIFDFGEVRVRQAEQTYMQAVNRLAEKAVNVRSEARDAYRTYRSTYDIAAHYQREVLPLRKIISDEMMLRYGAMQIDVFALLAEARQRLNATVTAAEAKRDFWLAQSELTFVVFGGGAAGAGIDNTRPMAASEGEGAPH